MDEINTWGPILAHESPETVNPSPSSWNDKKKSEQFGMK